MTRYGRAETDSDIRNIAVSGPFGAGKSTVVDSWERDARQCEGGRPWVHVSLARFSGEGDGKRDVGIELQARERENASAFDRYMDDVVYLLASFGADVI